jgi:hypothetical protein
MTTREKVISALELLNETQLRLVADYLKFLKSRKEKGRREIMAHSRTTAFSILEKIPLKWEFLTRLKTWMIICIDNE